MSGYGLRRRCGLLRYDHAGRIALKVNACPAARHRSQIAPRVAGIGPERGTQLVWRDGIANPFGDLITNPDGERPASPLVNRERLRETSRPVA